MEDELRFDIGSYVDYIFSEPDAECYKVIATRDIPHTGSGVMEVTDGNDYTIVKILTNKHDVRVRQYLDVPEGHLDPLNIITIELLEFSLMEPNHGIVIERAIDGPELVQYPNPRDNKLVFRFWPPSFPEVRLLLNQHNVAFSIIN